MSETFFLIFCDIKCGKTQLNNKGIKEIFFSIIVTKVKTVGEKNEIFLTLHSQQWKKKH